jgi:Arc/MetJ-type ribon-helix-helix transcriptional regulator
MGMKLIQLRLPEAIIKDINRIVKRGYYSTKSELIRDSVRRLLQRRPRLIEETPTQSGKPPQINKHGIDEFDYIH